MKVHLKNLWQLLKATTREWNNKDPFRQSAVIAYYSIFSMPGLLVLIVAVAGYFFGREEVSENILSQISSTLGSETAAQINDILEKSSASRSTLFGSIVGGLILLLGATGVFIELQKTLNIIWHVETTPKKGIWPIIKARLFSFGLILAIAFLLLISLVISTVITLITDMIRVDEMNLVSVLIHVLNFLISLAVISFLFALIFKILPDVRIQWKHVWFGAVLTGLLFTIGKTALTFYFNTAEPASAYGAAGSVVLILLWVSYSSMIVFFGAEFTYQYAHKLSGRVAPSEIAKKMPMSKIQTQL